MFGRVHHVPVSLLCALVWVGALLTNEEGLGPRPEPLSPAAAKLLEPQYDRSIAETRLGGLVTLNLLQDPPTVFNNGKTSQTAIRFEVQLQSDTPPNVLLRYLRDSSSALETIRFAFLIEKIVEYQDTNANGKFENTDAILSEINFEKYMWDSLVQTETISPADPSIKILTTKIKSLSGIVTLQFDAATKSCEYEGVTLTPSSLRLRIIVEHYAYRSPISDLALKFAIGHTPQANMTFSKSPISDLAKNFAFGHPPNGDTSLSEVKADTHDPALRSQVSVENPDDKNRAYFSWLDVARTESAAQSVEHSDAAHITQRAPLHWAVPTPVPMLYYAVYFTLQANGARRLVWDTAAGISSPEHPPVAATPAPAAPATNNANKKSGVAKSDSAACRPPGVTVLLALMCVCFGWFI